MRCHTCEVQRRLTAVVGTAQQPPVAVLLAAGGTSRRGSMEQQQFQGRSSSSLSRTAAAIMEGSVAQYGILCEVELLLPAAAAAGEDHLYTSVSTKLTGQQEWRAVAFIHHLHPTTTAAAAAAMMVVVVVIVVHDKQLEHVWQIEPNHQMDCGYGAGIDDATQCCCCYCWISIRIMVRHVHVFDLSSSIGG